ncbi:MAG: translesion DNA synthesis-associated protein ImuA [Lysobacterales bacterium]
MSALHALPTLLPSLESGLAPTALSTQELLQREDIWRARTGSQQKLATQATGCAELDAQLPGQGWPIGRLSEVLLPQLGLGEIELLLPLLARRSQLGQTLVYVRPPCPPNIPALARAGVALDRVLLIVPANEREALWASEQILGCGSACSVLLWAEQADERALRRLALAAEGSRSLALVFRPIAQQAQVSPAALRIRIDRPLARAPLSVLKARGLPCSSAQPLRVRVS